MWGSVHSVSDNFTSSLELCIIYSAGYDRLLCCDWSIYDNQIILKHNISVAPSEFDKPPPSHPHTHMPPGELVWNLFTECLRLGWHDDKRQWKFSQWIQRLPLHPHSRHSTTHLLLHWHSYMHMWLCNQQNLCIYIHLESTDCVVLRVLCGCQWPGVGSSGRSWSPPDTTSHRPGPDWGRDQTTQVLSISCGGTQRCDVVYLMMAQCEKVQLTPRCLLPSPMTEWWHSRAGQKNQTQKFVTQQDSRFFFDLYTRKANMYIYTSPLLVPPTMK